MSAWLRSHTIITFEMILFRFNTILCSFLHSFRVKFLFHSPFSPCYPSIHHYGSGPAGVQCPLTSSLGEFLGYRAGSGILGYRTCWCPSPLPSPSISRCFFIHSSSPAIGFHTCFFFTATYLHPFGRPFTYSLFR